MLNPLIHCQISRYLLGDYLHLTLKLHSIDKQKQKFSPLYTANDYLLACQIELNLLRLLFPELLLEILKLLSERVREERPDQGRS